MTGTKKEQMIYLTGILINSNIKNMKKIIELKQKFIPLEEIPCDTKEQASQYLQYQGYMNISYSGKLQGFYVKYK